MLLRDEEQHLRVLKSKSGRLFGTVHDKHARGGGRRHVAAQTETSKGDGKGDGGGDCVDDAFVFPVCRVTAGLLWGQYNKNVSHSLFPAWGPGFI